MKKTITENEIGKTEKDFNASDALFWHRLDIFYETGCCKLERQTNKKDERSRKTNEQNRQKKVTNKYIDRETNGRSASP